MDEFTKLFVNVFTKLFVNVFAVSGGWKLQGTLRLGKLGLGACFGPPKRDSIRSVIFTNEGKSHERTESKAQRHKSRFEV
jgi:hypothetical protein